MMNDSADSSLADWTAHIINGSAELTNNNGHENAATRKEAKKKAEAIRKKFSREQLHLRRKIIPNLGECSIPVTYWIGDMINGEWKTATQLSQVGAVKLYGIRGITKKDAIVIKDENNILRVVEYSRVMRTPTQRQQCSPKLRGINSNADLAVVGEILTGPCFCDAGGGHVRVKWANSEQDWRPIQNLEELSDLGERKRTNSRMFLPGVSEGGEYGGGITNVTSLSKVGVLTVVESWLCANGEGATAKDAFGEGQVRVKENKDRERLRERRKLLKELCKHYTPTDNQQRIVQLLAKLESEEELVTKLEGKMDEHNEQGHDQNHLYRQQQKLLLERRKNELLDLQAEEQFMMDQIGQLVKQQKTIFDNVFWKYTRMKDLEKYIKDYMKLQEVDHEDKEFLEKQVKQNTKELDELLRVDYLLNDLQKRDQREREKERLEELYEDVKKERQKYKREFKRVKQKPKLQKLGVGEDLLAQEILGLSLDFEKLKGVRTGSIPNLDEAIRDKEEEEGEEIMQSTNNLPHQGRYLCSIASSVTSRRQAEAKVAQDQKKEERKTPKCEEKNCDNFARPGGYCMHHSKTPSNNMCKRCDKRVGQRAGGLCRPCFDDVHGDTTILCSVCIARPARQLGGRCQDCIANKRMLGKKNCPICKKYRPRHAGGLCNACFNDEKGEGQSSKKRKFM